MRKGFLLLVVCFFTTKVIAQNCTTNVTLGEDRVVCDPTSLTSLTGIIVGDYVDFLWSPASVIFDTTSLNPGIQIDSTTTFSLTALSISDVDLIVNGDFSQGNTGFTTDYAYRTGRGSITQEGTYSVATSPRDVHNRFASYEDHTNTADGNMMVVNGSGVTNNVWCQNITVTPGTDYIFSAWVASAESQNPAELQFSINGNLLGDNFKASTTTGQWEQFSALWQAQSETSAEICIVNVNLDPAGNDFTLDDIEFRELCRITDELTIQVPQLNPDFSVDLSYCQNDPAVALNTLLAAGATPGGEWTIDNVPATTLDPAMLTPGPHTITYRVNELGCPASAVQNINIEPAPSPGVPFNETVTFCADLDTILSLDAFLSNADPGGVWTLENSPLPIGAGRVLDGASIGLTNPPAGDYQLRYTVAGNANCTEAFSEFTVTVIANPLAEAGDDQSFICETDVVTLQAAPDQSPSTQYVWQDEANQVLGNDLSVEISAPGTYFLVATDVNTGCSSMDTVVVAPPDNNSRIEGTVTVSSPDCNNTTSGATLTISNVQGGDAPYSFAIDGENFQSSEVFNNIPAGDYEIIIQDINGCEGTISASIASIQPLTVNLGSKADPVINPGDSLLLLATVNVPETTIDSVLWNPEIPGCNNCLNPIVNPFSTTRYTVTVIDQNGCSSTASFSVQVNEAKFAFIPNIFSPNDDGVNDQFFVNSGEAVNRVISFVILDRWGNLVFDNKDFLPNDPNLGWDGTFNGQFAPEGTYVYAAELELANGDLVLEKGEVQLMR